MVLGMSKQYVPRYTAGVRMILDALAAADSPMWGKRIIFLTGMKSGSVYPVLSRLERARPPLVESFWEEARAGLGRPARHYYTITSWGRVRHGEETQRLAAIAGQIAAPAVADAEVTPGELGAPLAESPWAVPFRPAI